MLLTKNLHGSIVILQIRLHYKWIVYTDDWQISWCQEKTILRCLESFWYVPSCKKPFTLRTYSVSILKPPYIILCIKIMHWKFHSLIHKYSLIQFKRSSPFMRYLFIGYQYGKWSEKLLNVLKTIISFSYSQIHRTDKYSQHSFIIWSV